MSITGLHICMETASAPAEGGLAADQPGSPGTQRGTCAE